MPIHAALLAAVQNAELQTVKELTQTEAVINSINDKDEDGNTILHYAVKLKEIPAANLRLIFRALEAANVDITAVNKFGANVFIEAIRANNEELATSILEKITEKKPELASKFVNQLYGTRDLPLKGDGKGYNALHPTAARGYTALLKAELVAGANIVCDANGWSALHDAVQKGVVVNVNLLIEHKADVNQAAGQSKRTPLSDAFKYYRKDHKVSQLQIIKALLEAKPDLNQIITNDAHRQQKIQEYAIDSCVKSKTIDSALFELLVPSYISLDAMDKYLKTQSAEIARLFKFELDALRPQAAKQPQSSSAATLPGLRQRFSAAFSSSSSSSSSSTAAPITDDDEEALLEMQVVNQTNSLNL